MLVGIFRFLLINFFIFFCGCRRVPKFNGPEGLILSSESLEFSKFLRDIDKVNKYDEVVLATECDHTEKQHSNEELRLSKVFSLAMIEAVNKLRKNPEYYLAKIIEEKDLILSNRIEESDARPLHYVSGINYVTKNSYKDKKHYSEINYYASTNKVVEGISVYDDAMEALSVYINSVKKGGEQLRQLEYSEELMNSALLHAKAMSKHGSYGHRGICNPILENVRLDDTDLPIEGLAELHGASHEGSFQKVSNRAKYYATDEHSVGENLGYFSIGLNKMRNLNDLAERIVLNYYIDDDDNPDRGHRNALMNRDYTHLGTALYRHPGKTDIDLNSTYQYYVDVMNFWVA